MKKLLTFLIFLAIVLVAGLAIGAILWKKRMCVPPVRPVLYFDESEIPVPPSASMMASPIVPPKRRAPINKSNKSNDSSRGVDRSNSAANITKPEKKVRFSIKEYGPGYIS